MNQSILIFLNSFTIGHSTFSSIVTILSEQFSYFVILLAIFLFLFYKSKGRNIFETLNNEIKDIIVVLVSVLGAWGVAYILKIIIHIPRPYQVLGIINPLYLNGLDNSFPSGHATLFFALATAVYLHHKKSGMILYLCALFIGISRIIAGVHYPLDILAGAVLGILFTLLVRKFGSKFL